MRVLVQRVKAAAVRIDGRVVGEVGTGVMALLGVAHADTAAEVDFLADKLVNLRIFEDEAGKMNRSLLDVGGAALVVSQFTLYGDCRKGRRPSFTDAAAPAVAIPLYERFVAQVRAAGVTVGTGEFGADMEVEIHNSGPVTLMLERNHEDEPKN